MDASNPNTMDKEASHEADITATTDVQQDADEESLTLSHEDIAANPFAEKILEMVIGPKIRSRGRDPIMNFSILRKYRKARKRALFELYAQGYSPPVSSEYFLWLITFHIWCDHHLSSGNDDLQEFPLEPNCPDPWDSPPSEEYSEYWNMRIAHCGSKNIRQKIFKDTGASYPNRANDTKSTLQYRIISLQQQHFSRIEEREKEQASHKDYKRQVQNIISDLNASAATLKKEITDLKKQVRELKTIQRNLLNTNEDFKGEKQELLEEKAHLLALNRTLDENNEKAIVTQRDLEEELRVCRSKNEGMIERITSLEREKTIFKSQQHSANQQWEREHTALKTLKRKYSDYTESVEQALAGLKQAAEKRPLLEDTQSGVDN
ncbi:hypothetical protein F4779DRAFT_358543 [Xylariaceae sp. FL0662B]|nr:hypothetical protein F4779DRAFT_358543 [Xylariaceae sp. FL0662B]